MSDTNPTKTNTTGSQLTQYDANSWKEIIPDSCQSFYDGCNQCNKIGTGGEAACTRMYCENYAEPYCKDNATTPAGTGMINNSQEEYIGLTVEKATELANTNRTPFRIVELDGQPQAVTMDLRPGRINAVVSSGIVVDFSVEGGNEVM